MSKNKNKSLFKRLGAALQQPNEPQSNNPLDQNISDLKEFLEGLYQEFDRDGFVTEDVNLVDAANLVHRMSLTEKYTTDHSTPERALNKNQRIQMLVQEAKGNPLARISTPIKKQWFPLYYLKDTEAESKTFEASKAKYYKYLSSIAQGCFIYVFKQLTTEMIISLTEEAGITKCPLKEIDQLISKYNAKYEKFKNFEEFYIFKTLPNSFPEKSELIKDEMELSSRDKHIESYRRIRRLLLLKPSITAETTLENFIPIMNEYNTFLNSALKSSMFQRQYSLFYKHVAASFKHLTPAFAYTLEEVKPIRFLEYQKIEPADTEILRTQFTSLKSLFEHHAAKDFMIGFCTKFIKFQAELKSDHYVNAHNADRIIGKAGSLIEKFENDCLPKLNSIPGLNLTDLFNPIRDQVNLLKEKYPSPQQKLGDFSILSI